jgi:hypothetical protein
MPAPAILVGLGFGFTASALCVRYMMIEASMVRDLLADDPAFKPSYGEFSLDPKVRTRHARAYRERFPDGPLTAKLVQVQCALIILFLLGVFLLAGMQASPR